MFHLKFSHVWFNLKLEFVDWLFSGDQLFLSLIQIKLGLLYCNLSRYELLLKLNQRCMDFMMTVWNCGLFLGSWAPLFGIWRNLVFSFEVIKVVNDAVLLLRGLKRSQIFKVDISWFFIFVISERRHCSRLLTLPQILLFGDIYFFSFFIKKFLLKTKNLHLKLFYLRLMLLHFFCQLNNLIFGLIDLKQ